VSYVKINKYLSIVATEILVYHDTLHFEIYFLVHAFGTKGRNEISKGRQ